MAVCPPQSNLRLHLYYFTCQRIKFVHGLQSAGITVSLFAMTCAGMSEADSTLHAEICYLLSLLLQWKDCKEELKAISPNQLLLQALLAEDAQSLGLSGTYAANPPLLH